MLASWLVATDGNSAQRLTASNVEAFGPFQANQFRDWCAQRLTASNVEAYMHSSNFPSCDRTCSTPNGI